MKEQKSHRVQSFYQIILPFCALLTIIGVFCYMLIFTSFGGKFDMRMASDISIAYLILLILPFALIILGSLIALILLIFKASGWLSQVLPTIRDYNQKIMAITKRMSVSSAKPFIQIESLLTLFRKTTLEDRYVRKEK